MKIILKSLMTIICLVSLINAQGLLQGLSHPEDAQGWGLQAFSTFKANGTGASLNPAITGLSDNYIKFNYTNFVLDINSTSLGYLNSSKFGKYGISVRALNYGEWDKRDPNGNKTGSYGVNDIYSKIAWGFKISSQLHAGINLNYGHSSLYNYSADYLTGGLGLIYILDSDIVIGLSAINNVITGKSYSKKEELESLIILGVSKKLEYLPMRMGFDILRDSNNQYLFNLGGRLFVNKLYFLWGISSKKEGLSIEDPVNNLIAGISAGFGINFNPYSLSFGYRNLGGMGSIMSFSVNWKLKKDNNE